MAQPPGYPPYPGAPADSYGYPPAGAYPPQSGAPGYPPSSSYPPEFAPPGSAYPPSGYPPQPSPAGYPPPSASGYPPQPSAGYPPQPSPAGYPPQPSSAGYPPQPSPAGYPPQPSPAGYPPQPSPAGYPPQPSSAGYPPPSAAGYPPQPTPAGYPPQPTTGYPPQPSPAGYPPQAAPAGYPPQPGAAGYPPQANAAYGFAPPSTATYPAQPGYGAYPGAAVPAPQFPHAPIQPQTAMYTQAQVPIAGQMQVQTGMYAMPRTDAGTVFPYPNFNVETDCETLRKAMKGIGTDEKAIIECLAHRSNAQRQEIVKKYKTMFGKDLIKELRSELTGNFEHTIISLMLTPAEFRAKEMRDAMKGAGTDEVALIQVLCTSSNQMIRDTREAYKRMYGRDLENDIEKETSGHFKRLLVACVNACRNESSTVDMGKAQTLAEQLYRSGAGKVGTDETGFLRVLGNESYPQLQAVFDVYRQKYSKTIEDSLKSEMSGDLLRGMLAIVRCVINPPAYFAKVLHESMAGAGTRDHELVRVVVMRCEVDMQLIKQEYQRQFGKALAHTIVNDTSGDYKKVLVALVGP